MKDFHKHPFSFSAFLLTVFVVLFLVILFSGEAFALQPAGGKKTPKAPAPVPKTGQTISYLTGDDGYWQKGVAWPEHRFSDNGDGTITDNLTKLMWTKSARQLPGRYVWNDALTVCNEFVFADHDDWRLPNVKEILSLMDYGQKFPALPPGHPFTDVVYPDDTLYWTSTTWADDAVAAWLVRFDRGEASLMGKGSSDPLGGLRAWAVRDAR